jgi:hypothetical protein
MPKRFVVGVVLAAAIFGGLLVACSSQESHPPTLDCTLACSTRATTGGSSTADSSDTAKPADDAAPDVVLDAGPQ